jgi:tetratricopeptide (TPR) repeat protein
MASRLEQLQQMLKEEPLDPFLNYAIALEHAKNGDVQKAITIIEEVLMRDENYLGAYYQLGKYYEENDQKEKAISTYKKGIEIAKKQNNRKTLGELNTALMLLEDED